MANETLENGLAALGFARRVTTSLLEDIPQDKLTHQPIPGANHAMWIMGHVAVTDAFFLDQLDGRTVGGLEEWKALFFRGSQPKPNVSDYPPVAEVKRLLDRSREQVIAWFRSLDDVQLKAPLPDDLKGFGPLHVNLMTSTAVHEGMHAGQLAVIRKSLGIGPKFG
ncbi:MAG: DinB family protein [Phycisphaerae bacterium]|nr:DinB family protein [Phycisphaerae bacterium]